MKISAILKDYFINEDTTKDSKKIEQYLQGAFDQIQKSYPAYFNNFERILDYYIFTKHILDYYIFTIRTIYIEKIQEAFNRDAVFIPRSDNPNWQAQCLYVGSQPSPGNKYDFSHLLLHETRHIFWAALHKAVTNQIKTVPFFQILKNKKLNL